MTEIDINKCLANEVRKRVLAKKGRADGVRAVVASPEGNRQERRMYAKRAKAKAKAKAKAAILPYLVGGE